MASSTTTDTQMGLGPPTDLENAAKGSQSDLFSQLEKLLGGGAGQSDVTASLNASRDYAANGPNTADSQAATNFLTPILAKEKASLEQGYSDRAAQFKAQAKLSGMQSEDNVFTNKLNQSKTNALNLFNKNAGALQTQYTQQAGANRINFLQGIASSALQNKSLLAGLAGGAADLERQFRLQTAATYSYEGGSDPVSTAGSAFGAVGGGIDMLNKLFGTSK